MKYYLRVYRSEMKLVEITEDEFKHAYAFSEEDKLWNRIKDDPKRVIHSEVEEQPESLEEVAEDGDEKTWGSITSDVELDENGDPKKTKKRTQVIYLEKSETEPELFNKTETLNPEEFNVIGGKQS